MNTDKIRKGIMVLMIFMIFLLPQSINAQEISLRIDSLTEEVGVGDLVVIRVTFESGDPIGTINADVSYDDTRLEYQYGGGNVAQFGGGTGGISDTLTTGVTTRSYEFTFLTIESGTANFSVDFSEIIAFEAGHLLGEPSSSIEFTISEEDSTSEEAEEAQEAEESQPEEPEEEESDDEPDEESQETIMTTLAEYQLYSVYQQFPGYEMTVIQAGESSVAAFRSEHLPENVYLVFASKGETPPKPYFFDRQENTLQRALIEVLELEREVEVSSEEDAEYPLLSGPVIFLIVLALLLIIALVILEQVLGNTKSNKQRGDQDEI